MMKLVTIADAAFANDGSLEMMKEHFTEEWLKTHDAWNAARVVFPGVRQTSDHALAFTEWPDDPYVLTYRDKLLKTFGAESFLPDRTDLARRCWDAMPNHKGGELIAFMRLYAQIVGIELTISDGDKRQPMNNNILNINQMSVTNGVIPVRQFDNQQERATFEARAAPGQAALVDRARKLAT
jgi:hypothetical protein